MPAIVFDHRACLLGEGPIWHPGREQFFWFDIFARKLLSRESRQGDFSGAPLEWQFDEYVSAAGWIDENHLLLATETALLRFHIDSGRHERIIGLEADNVLTRSNDGRADPFGGFWISTMGKDAAPKAGAIYRYYRGELRRIFQELTIPNSICFAPDGRYLYFTDNGARLIIFRQALDASGWPRGAPAVFVDLESENRIADGSVVDTEGAVWNAQWGSSRVSRYLPDGRLDCVIPVPAVHTSCPAFGGRDMKSLLVTSARGYLDQPSECDGQTFLVTDTPFQGIPEPQVLL